MFVLNHGSMHRKLESMIPYTISQEEYEHIIISYFSMYVQERKK